MGGSLLSVLICCSSKTSNYSERFNQWPNKFYLLVWYFFILCVLRLVSPFAARHHLTYSHLVQPMNHMLSVTTRVAPALFAHFNFFFFLVCFSLVLSGFLFNWEHHPVSLISSSSELVSPTVPVISSIMSLCLLKRARDGLYKCACLTFLLCPIYVTFNVICLSWRRTVNQLTPPSAYSSFINKIFFTHQQIPLLWVAFPFLSQKLPHGGECPRSIAEPPHTSIQAFLLLIFFFFFCIAGMSAKVGRDGWLCLEG